MLKMFLLLSLFSCSHFQRDLASNSQQTTKVAVVNYRLTGSENFTKHMERINSFAKEANNKKASFLLLPELMVLNLLPANPSEEKMKDHLNELASYASEYEKTLKEISLKNRIHIIGASIVIKADEKFINRGFFITPEGQVQYQDKVFPTPWERKHNFIGGKKIETFKVKDFSFVILICHDAEFSSISSSLIKVKPEVIFVPSQTDDVYGLNRVRRTSEARAIENMSYVLMTGTSGDPEAPWHSFIGQNFLFTPQNKYFEDMEKRGPYNEETLSFFDIDLKKLRESRKDIRQVYPARDELLYQ